MILILTKAGDSHADHVAALLAERGARFARFDPGDVAATRVMAAHAAGGNRMTITTSAGELDLDDVSVAWLRRPSAPQADAAITEPAMRRYVALELELLLDGLWEALDCAWLPGRYADVRRADHKLKQLELARTIGFTVPPTLITNDARELMQFFEAHGGQLISKLPSPAIFWTEPRVAVRYTQLVTRADLGYAASTLRYAPMLFQPCIAKELEIRVTVVGDQVFAAAIHTQRNARTEIDSRADFVRTHYEAHALPASVERHCRAITARSGLTYATIDLILTPEGDYAFLELNPNGQYLWVEQRTNLPITAALVDLLIDHEAHHDERRCERAAL
ncbi:MAG: hypothetical protein JO257_29870 [Deltaproteobacteria bacterium]|nr:hypothetical protein [Deltaproteobacteria bacterium]